VTLSPTSATSSRHTKDIRPAVAGSPGTTMPGTAAPAAPVPAHPSYAVPIGSDLAAHDSGSRPATVPAPVGPPGTGRVNSSPRLRQTGVGLPAGSGKETERQRGR
jgi:hypothetical protein